MSADRPISDTTPINLKLVLAMLGVAISGAWGTWAFASATREDIRKDNATQAAALQTSVSDRLDAYSKITEAQFATQRVVVESLRDDVRDVVAFQKELNARIRELEQKVGK